MRRDSRVTFNRAEFTGSHVNFVGADFTGGQVDFDYAGRAGGSGRRIKGIILRTRPQVRSVCRPLTGPRPSVVRNRDAYATPGTPGRSRPEPPTWADPQKLRGTA